MPPLLYHCLLQVHSQFPVSLTSKTSHHRSSLSQGSPQADSQWKDQQDLHRTISTFQSLKALILKFPTEIQRATPALKNQGQFTFSFTLSSHMQEWSKFRATPFINEFYFPFSRGGLWSDIKSIKLFMDKKNLCQFQYYFPLCPSDTGEGAGAN